MKDIIKQIREYANEKLSEYIDVANYEYAARHAPYTNFSITPDEARELAGFIQAARQLADACEWVRVEDRLPEENKTVFAGKVGYYGVFQYVWVDSEAGYQWCKVYETIDFPDDWGKDAEWDDDYSWITHWMPLPEPPEDV